MLATVIKGEAAARISVRIMDAFFAMRDFLRANAPMLQRLTNLEQNLLQTNNILLSTLEHQQVTDHISMDKPSMLSNSCNNSYAKPPVA